MGKFGKKNKVKVNPLKYRNMLLGEPKIGKTTLMKQVAEKLAGEEGYIFAELGRERGADAIEGIVYENIPNWEVWLDFVDDIVKNKTSDYPELKLIICDTYDQYIDIACKEALDMWNRENTEKQAKSLNGAFGGFGKGEQKAIELMFEQMDRLESVGVSLWFIGHVKIKSVTDIASGESYQVLTSDQQQNFFNALKKNLHFLGLAYIDRDIVKEKTGKKDIKGNAIYKEVVKDETRKIKFRDNSYAIDCGSRFEAQVDECNLDADEYIAVLEGAIKAEIAKANTSVDERKEEEAKEEQAEAEAVAIAEETSKLNEQIQEQIAIIVDFVSENKSNMATIKPIIAKLKELGYANPKVINSLEDAIAIAKLCK